uniref:Uncharacterized protein n=1 Tax=Setaria italica TaxID=4555 RepID=K3XUK6_SETIT
MPVIAGARRGWDLVVVTWRQSLPPAAPSMRFLLCFVPQLSPAVS